MGDVELDEGIDVDTDIIERDPCANYVYVDIQGFQTTHNRFICKEFCLVDGDNVFHALVKSPFDLTRLSAHFKRQADWLVQYYHGLTFECGDVHIVELIEKMHVKLLNKTVFVTGHQKVGWLKYIFRECDIDCVNADAFGFDFGGRNFQTAAYGFCPYHDDLFKSGRKCSCAFSKALKLKDVVITNMNKG